MPTPANQSLNPQKSDQIIEKGKPDNKQNKNKLMAKPNIPPEGLLSPRKNSFSQTKERTDESLIKKWRQIVLSAISSKNDQADLKKTPDVKKPATGQIKDLTETTSFQKFEKPKSSIINIASKIKPASLGKRVKETKKETSTISQLTPTPPSVPPPIPQKISKSIIQPVKLLKPEIPQKEKKIIEKVIKKVEFKKIFCLKKFLYLLLLIIVFIVVFGFGIYYLNWQGNTIAKITKLIPYPLALIKTPCGYEIIKYYDFNENLKAINFFYQQKESQDKNFIAPSADQTCSDIYDKELKNKLMECLVKKRGVAISKEGLKTELEKVIIQAGDEEALSQIVKNLYNWDLETFKNKILYSYLLEKNLTESINQDSEINAINKTKAENVLKLVLENPKNFYNIAKKYSQDLDTQHRGGDLYWLEKGQLDPKLEEFVFSAEIGDVSEIIQTNAGYHILKITNKKTTPAATEMEQVRVSHILIKTRALDDWLEQELRKCEVYKFI